MSAGDVITVAVALGMCLGVATCILGLFFRRGDRRKVLAVAGWFVLFLSVVPLILWALFSLIPDRFRFLEWVIFLVVYAPLSWCFTERLISYVDTSGRR
jgi:hypothetical protein